MVFPSRDQVGYASIAVSDVVKRFAAPPAAGLTHNLPMVSNKTVRPSGEVTTLRGMCVWNSAGATSIGGRGGSMTSRVSEMRNGISLDAPLGQSTLRILPPAQK